MEDLIATYVHNWSHSKWIFQDVFMLLIMPDIINNAIYWKSYKWCLQQRTIVRGTECPNQNLLMCHLPMLTGMQTTKKDLKILCATRDSCSTSRCAIPPHASPNQLDWIESKISSRFVPLAYQLHHITWQGRCMWVLSLSCQRKLWVCNSNNVFNYWKMCEKA